MKSKVTSLLVWTALAGLVIGSCGKDAGQELGAPDQPASTADLRGASVSRDSASAGASVVVPRIAEEADRYRATARPVIVLALDGADWELLDRYLEAGLMPELERLSREGAGGELLTESPALSPLVWTTIVTGTSPLVHGVLDFTRYNPVSGVKEPITSTERRVPAIWNMVSQSGRKTSTFGLWATYPAETVNGLMVSDRMLTFLYNEGTPPPGSVFPPGREDWARRIRRQVEGEVDFEAVRDYLPGLQREEYDRFAEVENPYGHPIGALRRILVETEFYRQLALDALREDRYDLSLVFFQGSDSVGHVFAPYAPPRQEGVSAEEFARYSSVPERFFAHLDQILGEFRALAEEQGAVLMLVSDHGFLWSEGRPTVSSFAIATAARWHRQQGIYLLWGPGIGPRPGHRGNGGIRSVCATLLGLLGLPAGEGVAGPPLAGVEPTPGEPVDYRIAYAPARDPVSTETRSAEQEIEKLRALGYLSASEPAAAKDRHPEFPTRSASSFNNQGLLLRFEGRDQEAVEAFKTALEINPDLTSALWNLSDLLFAQEKLEESDRFLLRAVANHHPEGVQYLIGRAIGYHRNDQADRSRRLLERAVEARPEEPELWLFRGRYLIDAGDCATASESFDRALALDPANPGAFAAAAMAKVCLGDREGAIAALRRSLELDPSQPAVQKMLRELG